MISFYLHCGIDWVICESCCWHQMFFYKSTPELSGDFLLFGKGHFKLKATLSTFCATFGKFGLLFIPGIWSHCGCAFNDCKWLLELKNVDLAKMI